METLKEKERNKIKKKEKIEYYKGIRKDTRMKMKREKNNGEK
jgi:ribosomal protein S13